jgi:hypothetical protein
MASAFTPTMSRGRPGRCTSPAEIMVVTPPFRLLSIQRSWFCRGVQSPNAGCTWLSISPGDNALPFASIMTRAPSVSQSAARPTATMRPPSATMVSASRRGFSSAPDSSSPILRITSLPSCFSGPAA